MGVVQGVKVVQDVQDEIFSKIIRKRLAQNPQLLEN